MTFIVDGTNGLTYPNNTTQASAGQILQVVNAKYSTDSTFSSSTYTDTGLTASITPKFSTSKILVMVAINGQEKTNDTYAQFKLFRGTTEIAFVEYQGGYTGTTTTNSIGATTIDYLDSPATTSSTSYKMQIRNAGGVGAVKISSQNCVSTMTLMEIAS